MSPAAIRALPGERRVSYSAAWFVPVDVVTGLAPGLPLQVLLDIQDGEDWLPAGIGPTVTFSGAVGYPDLGRRRDAATAAPTRYRARFESGVYLALSRAYQDGEEFIAYPFDDTTPPAATASRVTVSLVPAAGYPFPGDVPVLYGQVSVAAGETLPDVLLVATVAPPVPQTMTGLTGPDGTFAFPLRWAPAGQAITVTATDYRHTPIRTGQLTVQLPDALGHNQQIVIGLRQGASTWPSTSAPASTSRNSTSARTPSRA